MLEVVSMWVAFVPALILGFILPDVFKVFSLEIEGPPNGRYITLSVLVWPWHIATAVWMLWYGHAPFSMFRFFMAVFLALVLAMVGTFLRRYITPLVLAGVHHGARWLYKKTA